MTDIPRYNAPRGTTLCEAVGGELVMAADHDLQVSALRAALHSCAKASSAAEVGLIVDEALAASRAQQALAPENQRVVPDEPLLAPRHPFDKPSVLKECSVTYSSSSSRLANDEAFRGNDQALIASARALLSLDEKGALSGGGIGGHARSIISACVARLTGNGGLPEVVPEETPHIIVFDDADRPDEKFSGAGARPAALRRWEQISVSWNAHLFVRVERNSRDDPYPCARLAAQVSRIPAGLYAELEALRTLRDATGVYLQGYMRDEIEDEDNCVTEDQHDAACTVKLALDKAMALEWKGGGEDHSHG